MAEQILVAAHDARRIADLLRDVDDAEEAEVYADLLAEHADAHSFDDHFTEIGSIDNAIDATRSRSE